MSFLLLFWTFFKIGAFTFGGGMAMIGVAEGEVFRMGWMTKPEIADWIAISESTPGPLAINMATAVGSNVGAEYGLLGSLFGAFCATLGTVLPSFIIILIVARCFEAFKKNRIVSSCINGLKPAVVALIGSALWSLGSNVFFPNGIDLAVFQSTDFYFSLVVFIGALILAFRKVHPILIIALSAVCGIGAGYLLPS